MAKKKAGLLAVLKNKTLTVSRMINAGNRVLPDFLIIGAAKAGTTSLFNYLIQHPSVASPTRKEISYFSTHYRKGINWYKSHFPLISEMKSEGKTLCGEASPYYLSHPLAPGRTHELLPDVKLIVLLRNPIDRAISNYKHIVRLGFEKETFEKAIELEPVRLEGEEQKIVSDGNYFSLVHQYHSYLNRGIYWKELERWFKYYPRNKILIINSESFYHDPAPWFDNTLNFLNISPWKPGNFMQFNKSSENIPIPAGLRLKLSEFYKPHNERLYELIGERYNWDE